MLEHTRKVEEENCNFQEHFIQDTNGKAYKIINNAVSFGGMNIFCYICKNKIAIHLSTWNLQQGKLQISSRDA